MFARIDQRPVARWWWTVDRWSLGALFVLIGFGVVMSMAASPAVAERLGYAPLHFAERQLATVPFAVAIMIAVSLLSPRDIRRLAFVGFAVAVLLLALTFVVGVEIKGARRWINLPGVSLQPSEFIKPTFAIVAAWLFAEQKEHPGFPGNAISIGLFLGLVAMLIKQPDLGMAVVVGCVWFAQFFMAGLRLYWVAAGTLAGMGGFVGAYLWLPHVTSRVNRFFDPAAGDSYQVNRSIEAFVNGGLWGRGPGEGTVKDVLPDAHADFVFAVAGEEFGAGGLHRHRRDFRLYRAARLLAAAAGGQSVRAAVGDRAVDAIRVAGNHQHGLDLAPDPDQGNDAAVHLLRRLVDARPGARHGDDAGLDPAPPRRERGVSAAAETRRRPSFVLAAGGTGGHLFPAQALAEQLARRGAAVHLATDRRADAFAAPIPGVEIWRVRAGRLGGGVLQSAFGLAVMAAGLIEARQLLRRLDPEAVIGFGGYPSVPTMLAARQLGFASVIHEQNVVLGRANRFLAKRVTRICTGFAETAGLRPADRDRAVHTGNPVRPAIRAVAGIAYRPPEADRPIELLILGGSQGARIFADVVPAALAALPVTLRAALRVSQQARPEDCGRVAAQLQAAGIAAEISSFFTDVPDRLARAQLVICRSGASTTSELAAAGRPALLVPYPYATDDHQTANARALAVAGAAWVVPQSALSAPLLTNQLSERLADAAGLAHAAAQARRFAVDDAAELLAAVVLGLAPSVGRAAARLGEHLA